MYKIGAIIGMLGIIVTCFYVLNPFSTSINCKWKQDKNCVNISQAQASEVGEKDQNLEDINSTILAQRSKLKINEEELRNNAKEMVSEKVIEQRNLLKQAQVELERELERQIQYQAQLLEDGKVIVAKHEAERQEKILEE